MKLFLILFAFFVTVAVGRPPNKLRQSESAYVSQGFLSYTATDGTGIQVNWVSDENGFQAKGDHSSSAAPPNPEHFLEFLIALIDATFVYESANNIKVEESGSREIGSAPEDIGTVSRGSYSYVTPDGVTLTVNWVADENGFQATGDHLPTPPPMPEHRF